MLSAAINASCGMLTLPYSRIVAFLLLVEQLPRPRRIASPLTPPSMRISCAHEE